MKYSLLSSGIPSKATDCLVVGVWTKNALTAQARALDEQLDGDLKRVIDSGDVAGNVGDLLFLQPRPGAARRVLLVGCGDEDKLDARNYRKAVSAALKAILKTGAKDATFTLA